MILPKVVKKHGLRLECFYVSTSIWSSAANIIDSSLMVIIIRRKSRKGIEILSQRYTHNYEI